MATNKTKLDPEKVRQEAAQSTTPPVTTAQVPKKRKDEFTRWTVKDVTLENGKVVTMPSVEISPKNESSQLVDGDRRMNLALETDIFTTPDSQDIYGVDEDGEPKLIGRTAIASDIKLTDPQVDVMDLGEGKKRYYRTHEVPSPTFGNVWDNNGANQNMRPGQVKGIILPVGMQKITLSLPVTKDLLELLDTFRNIDGKIPNGGYGTIPGAEKPDYMA